MTNLSKPKVGFSGDTILERVDSTHYRLMTNLIFTSSKYKVIVGPGFVTDGASIPEIFWTAVGCPFRGRYVGSAIIHDGLYGTHYLPKHECDELFLEMMQHNKVSYLRRMIIFAGVKFFGFHAYNSKSHETITNNRKLVTVEKIS